ncbi:hypothetical protein [Bacillus massilioanorexius]|uniref:hypothetical protein n=1 Tax=Bacillus massilioanorexius TaxID=1468413 RepID=UPI0002D88C9A|nr:hypothetical protein [Bacillus massilioanorexius]
MEELEGKIVSIYSKPSTLFIKERAKNLMTHPFFKEFISFFADTVLDIQNIK